MNPNPGTTRRALARGAPHGAPRPDRSAKTLGRGARETPVPESREPRRGASQGGASRAPHSRTPRILWDATQASPPPPEDPGAAGGVRRPALCQEEPRPLSGGATPLPPEATPLSGDCSALHRQKLVPASQDLGLFLPLNCLGLQKPAVPWSRIPEVPPPPRATPTVTLGSALGRPSGLQPRPHPLSTVPRSCQLQLRLF